MLKNLSNRFFLTLKPRPTPRFFSTKPIPALRIRPKSRQKQKSLIDAESWAVVGYSTAENYNLLELSQKLIDQGKLFLDLDYFKNFNLAFLGLYFQVELSRDLEGKVLCVKSVYEKLETDQTELSLKEIYFFEDGSTVFWNVPHLERTNVMQFLKVMIF